MGDRGFSIKNKIKYNKSFYKAFEVLIKKREKYEDLYKAVSAGIGPQIFAYQMMADKEALKKMFPGVPEESLPDGASLTRQLIDLKRNPFQKKVFLELKTIKNFSI